MGKALEQGGWVQESSPLPKMSSYRQQTIAKHTRKDLLPVCLLTPQQETRVEARSVLPGDLPQGGLTLPSAPVSSTTPDGALCGWREPLNCPSLPLGRD